MEIEDTTEQREETCEKHGAFVSRYLLREFARRTAQDHRGNPEAAYPQLRRINALGRELLARKWAETGHPSCAKVGTTLQSVTVR